MTNSLASSHAVGICGTLLLHVLFLQAVTLGASGPKRRVPDETGPGATAIVSGGDLSMTLVLVQLPGVTQASTLEQLASRGFTSSTGPIQVVSPDPTPAFDVPDDPGDENAEAAQTVGDPAARSLLFGRYTGQINARIERAWRRPRSAVTDETAAPSLAPSDDADIEQGGLFRCAVRITQDNRGNVKEIELVRCDGTLAWQQSLVNAIQQASPLPAPPSPTVFTNALTFTFESRAYTPGLHEDEYESVTYRLVQANSTVQGRYQSPPPAPNASEAAQTQSDPGLPFDAPVQAPHDSEFDPSPR